MGSKQGARLNIIDLADVLDGYLRLTRSGTVKFAQGIYEGGKSVDSLEEFTCLECAHVVQVSD